MGFFERLKEGLSKTRRNFTDRIQELVGLSAAIDDDFLDELEMILLSADVGVKTTEKLIDAVRKAAKKKEISGTEDVIPFLKKYMAEMLADSGQRTRIGAKPTVILVVGVNGVGKTTTMASWQITSPCSNTRLFWQQAIPSVLQQASSCRFGASVRIATLSAMLRVPTRRQLCLML